MSGLFNTFGTSQDKETSGVWLEYGDTRVKIARAGGRNTKFAKLLDKLLKPYRRAIQTDTMDEKVSKQIAMRAVVEGIIIDVETNGQPGVLPTKDGGTVPASLEAWTQLFDDLPDFWADIQSQSQNIALFRSEERTADAGN